MKTVKIELMNDSSEVVHYDREGVRLGIREGNLSAHPGLRAPCHWHDDLECIHILGGMMGYSINYLSELRKETDIGGDCVFRSCEPEQVLSTVPALPPAIPHCFFKRLPVKGQLQPVEKYGIEYYRNCAVLRV